MSLDNSDISQLDFSIIEHKEIIPKLYEYMDEHLPELAEKYIIPAISNIAKAMNIPDGFIDGLGVEKSGRNRVKIVNRWGTLDKPLALWFNYGTVDHGPVFANRLHWKDKRSGKDIYAKWVHGIPKTEAMELGIQLGQVRFIQNFLSQGKEYVLKELDLVR